MIERNNNSDIHKNENDNIKEEMSKDIVNENIEETENQKEKEVEDTVENTQREKSDLKQKVKDIYNDYLRSLADLENFRKRALKEKQENLIIGKEMILREIIELADDMERGKEHLLNTQNKDDLIQGMILIENKVHNILSHHKIAPYGKTGDIFDPKLHEAVGTKSVDNPDNANKISIILRKGYWNGERILRVAQVIVGVYQEESDDDDIEEDWY